MSKISKLEVESEKCIGCGMCVQIAPRAFKMDSQNKSKVKNNWQKSDHEKIKQADNACPVDAIKVQ